MLRRLAALAACVLLLGLASTGSVYVTTLPAGADVWLDGVYVGRTPLVIDALAAGRHTLGITKAGWNARQLDVSVEPGQTTLSSTRLQLAGRPSAVSPGSIAIRGLRPITVRIDGIAARPGKDGTYAVPSGSHEVVVQTPRGKATREVTVWPQTRTDVVLLPDDDARASVVAPADDFLPKKAVRVEGERVIIRYNRHEVLGRVGETTYRVDGRSVDFDAAPSVVGSRLYLPMDLLRSIAAHEER